MIFYDICLSLSELFHSVWQSLILVFLAIPVEFGQVILDFKPQSWSPLGTQFRSKLWPTGFGIWCLVSLSLWICIPYWSMEHSKAAQEPHNSLLYRPSFGQSYFFFSKLFLKYHSFVNSGTPGGAPMGDDRDELTEREVTWGSLSKLSHGWRWTWGPTSTGGFIFFPPVAQLPQSFGQ